MIDAHVHFWMYEPIRDSWINDEMEVIQRDFLPADLERFAPKFGLEGVIAVQADQSEAETSFLLNLAEQHQIIKGVVGWTDLRAGNLEDKLDKFGSHKKLKGFRHILQAEENEFMLNPSFIEGVRKLHPFHFTYDILVYYKQLPEVIRLLEKLPEQKLVIDHCAKPPIATGEMKNWAGDIRRIAADFPHVYCKISGLVTEASWHRWEKEDLIPYIDMVADSFGKNRIMFGSDWPVIYAGSHYGKWLKLMQEYMSQFSKPEQDAFFSGNAREFYNLSEA